MINNNLPPILYAEDNLMDVELTMDAFAESNISNRLDLVRDGQELLDYLRYEGAYTERQKEMPCVILLDNKMPRLSGLEALKIIKSDPTFKYIPVVMMTSSKLDNDLIDSYNYGVNAYVLKPLNMEQFIVAIQNIGLFWAVFNRTIEP